MNAGILRDELRENSRDRDLQKRRQVLALSALGIVDFVIISLYQSGVIKTLPDIPGHIFASNKVNAAEDAYIMGAPDATISTVAYAATMVLATWAGTEKSGRKPLHDVALGAVVAGNAAGAVFYLGNMVFKQRKICPYCIVGAAVNIASATIIAPIFIKSVKRLFGKTP